MTPIDLVSLRARLDALEGVTGPEELTAEEEIRPADFDNFIGQPKVKARLKVMIAGANVRGDVLDHIMLSGPPGLGKTTLARIVANEMRTEMRVVTGPAVRRLDDLALTELKRGDVLFIDEVHRLPVPVMESLLPVMEEFELDHSHQGARRRVDLPHFTMIGATTDPALVLKPMRDRFGHEERLTYYGVDDLTAIVQRSAELMELSVTLAAATEIARRSRMTPRLANRLLARVRDYAVYADASRYQLIDLPIAKAGLELFGVDSRGLDVTARGILTRLADAPGPMGLTTIAASLGEATETIAEMYEPFLLRTGLIERTPRGRVITVKGRTHVETLPVA